MHPGLGQIDDRADFDLRADSVWMNVGIIRHFEPHFLI